MSTKYTLYEVKLCMLLKWCYSWIVYATSATKNQHLCRLSRLHHYNNQDIHIPSFAPNFLLFILISLFSRLLVPLALCKHMHSMKHMFGMHSISYINDSFSFFLSQSGINLSENATMKCLYLAIFRNNLDWNFSLFI